MSEQPKQPVGAIGWVDLTVPNADEVRDFYGAVVGWTPTGLSMGDYEDYVMSSPATGDGVAGVCHARGANAGQPPVWMIYLIVEDLDASIAACNERGGQVIAGPRQMGAARYCVIRDPAGAICALYQQ